MTPARRLMKFQGTDYDDSEPEVHWDGQWLDVIHGGINTTYSRYPTKKADFYVPDLEGCETTEEAVDVCIRMYEDGTCHN